MSGDMTEQDLLRRRRRELREQEWIAQLNQARDDQERERRFRVGEELVQIHRRQREAGRL